MLLEALARPSGCDRDGLDAEGVAGEGARPSSTESVVASRARRSGQEPRGATHHGHVAQAADDKQRGEEEQDEDDDGQPPVGVVVHAGC